MKFCPQCGTTIIPEDRFCEQCGFDISTIATVEQEVNQLPQIQVVEEVLAPVSQIQKPVPPVGVQQFCQQCGSAITTDDRFCLECGFDSSSYQPPDEKIFNPVDEIHIIHTPEPEPEQIPTPPTPPAAQEAEPIIPPPPSESTPEPKSAILPPTHEPAHAVESGDFPNVKPTKSAVKKNSKKIWLYIGIAVIAVSALGAAGLFGYNKYRTSQTKTPVKPIVINAVPKITAIDSSALNSKVTETPAQVTPGGSGASTKPQSSGDQKIAKQKAKEQNKPSKQTANLTQQTKPDPGVEGSSGTTGNDILEKVILKVGRKEDAKSKNPKNPVKFTIKHPTMIVRITTDHFNDGKGIPGGLTISIKDRNGLLIGNFMAKGKPGMNGTPNAKWVAEPHKVLEKGTYFIWDSDMPTWSKNIMGTGFIVVEGYEIK